MNNKIHVETSGQGPALVLVHGWGLNGAVWQQILPTLEQHFTVHCVDLPGFGHSAQCSVSTEFDDWVNQVVSVIDQPAIWLGWSLGGLVATRAAVLYPDRVTSLVTVASSPSFVQESDWPGIKPDVLALFQTQLSQDFAKTLERFLAIQALGSESAKADIKALHAMLKERPMPAPQALKLGLNFLETVDLRDSLAQIDVPFLRLYGRLDSLVSHRVIKQIDALAPRSQRIIMTKASHAPFISHREEFLEQLLSFIAH